MSKHVKCTSSHITNSTYNLYKKAQDAMLTTQQKLQRELQRIADEAKQWGWDKSIVEKMKELKTAELLGNQIEDLRQERQEMSTDAGKPADQNRNNSALELGTVAYYEAQMKDKNKPMVDEAKKSNKFLGELVKQGNRKPEVAPAQRFVIIS
jgi:hypothetical protein